MPLLFFFLCWLLLIFDFIINHAWSIRAIALNMFNYTCGDMNAPLHVLRYKKNKHKKSQHFLFWVVQAACVKVAVALCTWTRENVLSEHHRGVGGNSSGVLSAYSCQEKQWSAPRGQIITYACGNRCRHAFLCTRNDSLAITIRHGIHKGCGVQLYGVFFFSYLNTHTDITHTQTHKRPRVRI